MRPISKKKYFSPGEYLDFERSAFDRHEYFDGEIFGMAGSTFEYSIISSNINAGFNNRLKTRDCRSSSADLRVHVPSTGLYTYPGVLVVCGKPLFLEDAFLDTLLNPVLIVEVLSRSTEGYDKGSKFDHYRTIESLKEYVLVWQDKKRVARYTHRADGTWVLTDFIGDNAMVELSSIECTLSMQDIYDKVELD